LTVVAIGPKTDDGHDANHNADKDRDSCNTATDFLALSQLFKFGLTCTTIFFLAISLICTHEVKMLQVIKTSTASVDARGFNRSKIRWHIGR
jgi:hypothetical protein